MRISKSSVDAILDTIFTYAPKDKNVKIYLFGSRTQDHLKGGDIDLAVVCDDKELALNLKS